MPFLYFWGEYIERNNFRLPLIHFVNLTILSQLISNIATSDDAFWSTPSSQVEGQKKAFDRDKMSSCDRKTFRLSSALPSANPSDQRAHGAESKWPRATRRSEAPIHYNFLMSFDVGRPFFAGFAPFFVPFYGCKRANDPLCLCDNLLSVRPFLSPSFCLLSPHLGLGGVDWQKAYSWFCSRNETK